MPDRRWRLDIDESGKFQKEPGPSCIAGLLVDVTSGEISDATLRSAIGRCFPLLPWPPHATETRHTISYVAGAAITAAIDPKAPGAAIVAAMAMIEKASAPALAACRQKIRDGRMPDWEELRDASAAFAEADPKSNTEIMRYGMICSQRMTNLLSALRKVLPSKVFIIAAVGDEDSYPCVFDALICRLLELLRHGRFSPEAIALSVAELDVPIQHNRETTRVARLTSDHLDAWIKKAEALDFPLGVSVVRDVQFKVNSTVKWDKDCPPAIVLADHISNRLFGKLKLNSTSSWPNLQQSCDEILPLTLTARANVVDVHVPSITHVGTTQPHSSEKGTRSATAHVMSAAPPWALFQKWLWESALTHPVIP